MSAARMKDALCLGGECRPARIRRSGQLQYFNQLLGPAETTEVDRRHIRSADHGNTRPPDSVKQTGLATEILRASRCRWRPPPATQRGASVS